MELRPWSGSASWSARGTSQKWAGYDEPITKEKYEASGQSRVRSPGSTRWPHRSPARSAGSQPAEAGAAPAGATTHAARMSHSFSRQGHWPFKPESWVQNPGGMQMRSSRTGSGPRLLNEDVQVRVLPSARAEREKSATRLREYPATNRKILRVLILPWAPAACPIVRQPGESSIHSACDRLVRPC